MNMNKPLRFGITLWIFACLQIHVVLADGPRETQLFDFDWRFYKGDTTNAQNSAFDDRSWRLLDLPHDWSIEDLPALTNAQTEPALFVTKGTWRFQKGDNPAWKAATVDETQWETVELPATWEQHSNYTNDNVYGWFRRKITVPESYRGQDAWLELGWIDDVDQTYFNGQLVGSTGGFPPDFKTAYSEQRRYRIPKELIRYGQENTLAVRVFDGYGGGGIVAAASPRVVGGPFDSEAPGGIDTGFTIGGIGWYRKHFTLPKAWQGKVVTVQFEGVYMNADVWINGQHLGNHPYGYTSFTFDLSKHLRFGDQENVLAVQVKNLGRNSRWYAGSGIYRHVWLTATAPVRIAQWNPVITTPQVESNAATIRVQTKIEGATGQVSNVRFKIAILNPEGNQVASQEAPARLGDQESLAFDQTFQMDQPRLWSPEAPHLYKAVCELSQNGRIVDRVETPFGIRSIKFDPNLGFFLNGQRMKLKGGCLHDNNGALGAAAFDRAEERKVELLKAAGFNLLRSGHNPRAPEFLEACDRLGMMVLEEAFDMWQVGKRADDYHVFFDEWWQRDLSAVVENGRNHPSVILWGIGSEIREASVESGARLARQLAGFVRSLDSTRPITANVNRMGKAWPLYDPFFSALDVGGYSYGRDFYVSDHQRLPQRVILGTETSPRDTFDYWMNVVDHDYVAGDCVWTAMDYMGEASTGWWSYGHTPAEVFPWNVSYTGDLDICGFKRPRSYYRDVLWNHGSKLSAFVHSPVPSFAGPNKSEWGWDDVAVSWTWPGCEGKPLQVDVYSSCDRVQLTLNGRYLGTKPTSRETQFKAAWQVPYESGTLTAIGYTNNSEAARWELRTAGPPSGLRLTADRKTLKADGQDLCYVTVEVVDAKGLRQPDAEKLVRFSIEGEGTLMAVESSRPNSIESFQQPQRTTYDGRCLVILKAKRVSGTIKLTARAEGLAETSIEIKTQPDDGRQTAK
jgi:beta-galactosidase